jgi:hypothetical protein
MFDFLALPERHDRVPGMSGLSAPARRRRRCALSRLIPTRRAASATEPVSASKPTNFACRSGVHPSARARSGTGRNGGTRFHAGQRAGVLDSGMEEH